MRQILDDNGQVLAETKPDLAGDPTATIAKAEMLLGMARKELRAKKRDPLNDRDRAEIREIAHKGWLGVTTAADAWRRAHGQDVARNAADTRAVYGRLAAQEPFGNAEGVLHQACGYNDSVSSCHPKSIEGALRSAGQAIEKVNRDLAKRARPGRRRRRTT